MPKRIGVFGGTFNPPHRGHARAAASAAEQLGLDLVLLIPSGLPPHKELPQAAPTAAQRLEMTGLMARELPFARVLDIEIKRPGPSYTADTLEELGLLYPDSLFFLMVGADMFMTLQNWYQCGRIFSAARIAVFSRREDAGTEQLERQKKFLEDAYGARVEIIRNNVVEISSSQVRRAVRSGGGFEHLDLKVYRYIIENGLYGAGPGNNEQYFGHLRDRALESVEKKRIPHVLGCEIEAVSLAKRWGADQNDARAAAILHDITKSLDHDEQLKLCNKYGIIIDNVEKCEDKLLHSKTGAAVARDLYGVSDQIYSAILWHTTGRENMSLLEKVIYLADYIEPTREFEGIEQLRMLAYTDIDAALLLGYKMSVDEMIEKGRIVHPRTLKAIEWMEKNG